MADSTWTDVDSYFTETLIGDDKALSDALAANQAAGLPAIDVSPAQGKFLSVLAGAIGAKRVLEIGTLGGYSTIWLARAVGPDGHVTTLEYDPHHAEVARANLDNAGLGERVDIRVGAALESLPDIDGPFDLFFIDADKENNATYVDAALARSRPGSVIIVDNVVRRGAVADADSSDPAILGTRAVIELIADHPRLEGSALQTVGAKGWDGLAFALVTE